MIFNSVDLLKEACDPKDLCVGSDIDQQLTEKDLEKEYEKICPICPTDEASILEAFANPQTVRVIAAGDKFFVEASDLYRYMEHAGITTEAKAMNNIIRCNESDCPEMDKTNLVLVLPCDEAFAGITNESALATKINILIESDILITKRRCGLDILDESFKDIKEKMNKKGSASIAKDLVKNAAKNKTSLDSKCNGALNDPDINIKALKMTKSTADSILSLFSANVEAELKNYSTEERKPITALKNAAKSFSTKLDKKIAAKEKAQDK